MHSSLNLDVLRRLATDRESQLRPRAVFRPPSSRLPVLHSVGRRLMRLGTWLAADGPIAAAEAR